MSRRALSTSHLLLLSIPLALALSNALIGCGGGSGGGPSTPGPARAAASDAGPAPADADAGAPDPMKLSQTIYRVVYESDAVRLLEATFHPGDRIARHRHPDHVSYVVSGGRLRVTQNASPPRDVDIEAGEALPFFALEHSLENIGTTDVKVVVLELLTRGRSPMMPGRDAVTAAPDAYKTVFENERLRVLEATFPRGAKAAAHVHPDHAVYVITPGVLRIKSGVLPFHDFTLAAGNGLFLKSYGHAVENIGKTEVKLVVFELR